MRKKMNIENCINNCHAEGTGYEPPVLALRLDTPVIVY